jgi:uncharacterized protein
MKDYELKIRDEIVRLLPQGLLLWPDQGLLAVADFHLGKSETFGQNGFVLPGQAQQDDLETLRQAIYEHSITHLLFLGDLVHTRRGITPAVEQQFADWLKSLPTDTKITLIAGNHDRHLIQNFPVSWKSVEVVPEWSRSPFQFLHEAIPKLESPSSPTYTWAGHLHPCVTLTKGPDRLRLKVFSIGPNEGILPAYSSLAGGYDVGQTPLHHFYALAGDQVIEVTP